MPASADGIKRAITGTAGIEIPEGLHVNIKYDGNTHGGVYNVILADGEKCTPLSQGVIVESEVSALLFVYYLSAVLPSAWAWWHGKCDRDYVLIKNTTELIRQLSVEQIKEMKRGMMQVNDVPNLFPPAGVRVTRLKEGFEIACLASRPNRGLYDLRLRVCNCRALALHSETLLQPTGRVLY
jgi:hypothetical protein